MNLQQNARRLIAAGIVAATTAVGFAGSAQAVSSSGCTATPLKPVYHHHNAAGKKVLKYTIKVTCNAGRTITIYQERKEQDTFSDDLIGKTTWVRYFGAKTTKNLNFYGVLPDTELGKEEMYHRIRFRVSSNGVTSPLTGWHKSPAQAFFN